MSEPLTGLIAAVHTPFNVGGRLKAAVVQEQCGLLLESGVEGVFVGGTSGEGHSLTVAERRTLTDAWVAAADGRIPVLVHIGHNCVRDAIVLARHAQRAGATATAAMAPTYYRPRSVEDLIEFLAPIAAAAPELPFYYYDFPKYTGVEFPTDQLLKWGCLRIPNLRGAKFTDSNLSVFQAALEVDDGAFDVLLGQDDLYLAGLACGGRGAIGTTFNFAAPVYRRIRKAFADGDLETARAEQAKASELVRILSTFGTFRAGKALMSLLGVDCGATRTPLRPLDDRELRDLHEQVRRMDVFARHMSTPAELGR